MKKLMWSVRKNLAILLALIMCIGVIPCNIYAADENAIEEVQAEEVQTEEDSSFEELSVEVSEEAPSTPEAAPVIIETENSLPEVAVIIRPNPDPAIEPFEVVIVPADIIEEAGVSGENDTEEVAAFEDTSEPGESSEPLEPAEDADVNVESNNQYSEYIDKGAVSGDKGHAGGGTGEETSSASGYTLGTVTAGRAEGSSVTPSNGSENRYTFTFNATESVAGKADVNHSYSAYVYGNGVDSDVCTELAKAYLKGLTTAKGPGNNVIKRDFTDADKLSDTDYFEGYDSDLCWAYSASNALWQTQWITKADLGIFGAATQYFKSEDDVAEYAAYCFKDYGGDEKNLWHWMFTGEFLGDPNYMRFGPDENDAILGAYNQNGLYAKYTINAGCTESELANGLKLINGNSASTLGIYHFSNGGHALSLTGYILEGDVPVAVIVTDPDNSVKDPSQGLDQKKIDNVYTVYPISRGNVTFKDGSVKNLWYFMPDDSYDARIGDMSILNDSNGFSLAEDYTSPYPVGTRAVKYDMDSSLEYTIGDDASLDVPLDAEFLSYYDINNLFYVFADENDRIAFSGEIESDKATWNNLIGAEDISLIFGNAVNTLANGKYKLKVAIDYTSFFGNYGWFAKKSGYNNLLVDIWVNLLKTIKSSDDSSDSSSNAEEEAEDISYTDAGGKGSGSGESYTIYDEILDAFLEEYADLFEAFLNELLESTDIKSEQLTPKKNNNSVIVEIVDTLDNSSDNNNTVVLKNINEKTVKSNVQFVINDFIKATASDPVAIELFKSIGVNTAKTEIKNLNLILSTGIKMNEAGTVRFSSKDIKYKTNSRIFAMIKLANGKTRYVKAKIGKDGSISFALPKDVKEITVFSI